MVPIGKDSWDFGSETASPQPLTMKWHFIPGARNTPWNAHALDVLMMFAWRDSRELATPEASNAAIVAYPQFPVNDGTLSLSMIAPGQRTRKCAHRASCDGLEPIWRFAKSSGVR
jgi:hypothetical protein